MNKPIIESCRSGAIAAVVFGLLSALATESKAAPYGPEGRLTEWRQPDGKVIKVRVFGDDLSARAVTESGYTVAFNRADKSYCYAAKAADGSLVPTKTRAHLSPPAGTVKGLKMSKAAEAALRKANFEKYGDKTLLSDWRKMVQARLNKPASGGRSSKLLINGEPYADIIGNRVGLTFMVQFPDDPSTAVSDGRRFVIEREKIVRYCNGGAKAAIPPYFQDFAPYTDDYNTGSVYEYFHDQSNGLLHYTQIVTPILTLPFPRAYYNFADYPANGMPRDAGDSGRLLLKDAITTLRAVPGFDVSRLTTDAESKVIATNIFFAGEDSGIWAMGLWPHSSRLEIPVNVSNDDEIPKLISNYQITNLPDAAPKVGTFIHENGHLLCRFPDLYDYTYTTGGVGMHCLMAAGNMNNKERTPAPLNLHFKEICGWANLRSQFTTDMCGGEFSLPSTGNVGLKFRRPETLTWPPAYLAEDADGNPLVPGPEEYFLVENRGHGDRWAEGCPDKGIAIWHVRTDKDGNTIGDEEPVVDVIPPDFYQVGLEQADGLYELEAAPDEYGDNTDLFDTKLNYFADLASPTARWWNDNLNPQDPNRGTQAINSGLRLKVKSDPAPSMVVEVNSVLPFNTLRVSVPNGGETVFQGETVPIWWGANGLTGNVRVELLKGGSLVTVIANPVPVVIPATTYNNGTTNWIVPSDLTPGNDYTIRVTSLTNGAATDVSDANFTVSTTVPLADVLDTAGSLDWTTGGDAKWVGVTSESHDGVDSAASGLLNVDKRCWMETTVEGPGTLTYWARVSGEYGYDFLEDYVNGKLQPGRVSGETGWVQRTVQVPWGKFPGDKSTVRIQYNNDYNKVNGLNRAYVDQMVYTRTSVPDIAVEYPVGTSLADGTSTVDAGTVAVKGSSTVELKIFNTGNAPLTGLKAKLKSVTGSKFMLGKLSATVVNPGQSATLPVFFLPSKAGIHKALVQIESNDMDETPFDINMTGTGVVLPDIALEYPKRVNLTNNTAVISCGSASVGASATPLTFTIKNVGTAPLTGVVASFTGPDASAFQLVTAPPVSIAAGRSSSFQVAYRPTAGGLQSALLRVASDDPDENPFSVSLTGTGIAPVVLASQTVNPAQPSGGSVSAVQSDPGASESVLSPPWQVVSLGDAALSSAAASSGMVSVSGAGSFASVVSDEGTYAYQALTGDGSVIARLVASDAAVTNTSALMGVQIRSSLASSAVGATLGLNGASGAQWVSRINAGESSAPSAVAGTGKWLKLTRTGDQITASRSADGLTWTEVGTLNLVLPENCYIGLVVGSGSAGSSTKAVFDNVVITP